MLHRSYSIKLDNGGLDTHDTAIRLRRLEFALQKEYGDMKAAFKAIAAGQETLTESEWVGRASTVPGINADLASMSFRLMSRLSKDFQTISEHELAQFCGDPTLCWHWLSSEARFF